jgi:hypothetical protein
MGFSKTHLVGVFLTESLLGIVGVGVVVAALAGVFHDAVAWLLVAVCIFLLQLSVLLSSILSLLFYLGSRVETSTDDKGESSDHVAKQ